MVKKKEAPKKKKGEKKGNARCEKRWCYGGWKR